MPTNLPINTYQPTYQLTNLPTYQPTNPPTYQATKLPSSSCIRTRFPSRPSRLRTCLQAAKAAKAPSVLRTKAALVGYPKWFSKCGGGPQKSAGHPSQHRVRTEHLFLQAASHSVRRGVTLWNLCAHRVFTFCKNRAFCFEIMFTFAFAQLPEPLTAKPNHANQRTNQLTNPQTYQSSNIHPTKQ